MGTLPIYAVIIGFLLKLVKWVLIDFFQTLTGTSGSLVPI